MTALPLAPGTLRDKRSAKSPLGRSERHRLVAEALRDLLAVVNSGRSVDEILDEILSQAARLLASDGGAAYLLDEDDRDFLSVRASRDLDTEELAARLRLGSPATGLATLRRRPVAVSDLLAALPELDHVSPETHLADRASYLEVLKIGGPPSPDRIATAHARLQHLASRYRAILAVPLTVSEEAFGALTLYYRQPREFVEEDVNLASAFANQAALAIQNSRLYARAQEAAALEERQRLARDLHDAVTQTLFSASLIADVLPRTWERDPTLGMQHLEDLRRLTRGALAEMRTLLVELRSTALVDTPLPELLQQLAEATMGRRRLRVTVAIEGECSVPPDVQVVFYRVAQEALNNTAKHARAGHAELRLRSSNHSLELRIADDGRGFDPAVIQGGHLGVGIMRERSTSIGAELDINSQPDAGTHVTLNWRPPRVDSERQK